MREKALRIAFEGTRITRENWREILLEEVK